LAWLLSFYWKLDHAYDSIGELTPNLQQGRRPAGDIVSSLQVKCEAGLAGGLKLTPQAAAALRGLGIQAK